MAGRAARRNPTPTSSRSGSSAPARRSWAAGCSAAARAPGTTTTTATAGGATNRRFTTLSSCSPITSVVAGDGGRHDLQLRHRRDRVGARAGSRGGRRQGREGRRRRAGAGSSTSPRGWSTRCCSTSPRSCSAAASGCSPTAPLRGSRSRSRARSSRRKPPISSTGSSSNVCCVGSAPARGLHLEQMQRTRNGRTAETRYADGGGAGVSNRRARQRALVVGVQPGPTGRTTTRSPSSRSCCARRASRRPASWSSTATSPTPTATSARGKLAELKRAIGESDANLVAVDDELAPRQERNLEEELEVRLSTARRSSSTSSPTMRTAPRASPRSSSRSSSTTSRACVASGPTSSVSAPVVCRRHGNARAG